MEWLLPSFDIESFWEWLAARMHNYMHHLIKNKKWKPGYFNTSEDHVVLAHHIIRFYGCQSAIMIRGFSNIHDTWYTRESLSATICVKIAMPKYAYLDIYWCLNLTDDWEEEDGVEWGNE